MNRKILYLFNPISGTTRKDALLNKIEAATKARNFQFEFIKTNSSGDYELLKRKIKAEKFTDVVIIGGDGTVNQVTAALRGCAVRFGIIPRGSGNGLAFTAGIRKNLVQALEIIFKGDSKPIDAYMVNDHYACMLCGLGLDASVAEKFSMQRRRGLVTYTQQSVIQFFQASPYRFEMVLGDFSFFTDAYFISIANSNQFGNNVTIAPQASLSDGLLDIVVVQGMSKVMLPLAVLRQIQGNNRLQELAEDISNNTVIYFQASELIVKNFDMAPMHIDGEPRETAAVFHIKILKDCFELMQP
jgi:YegS/Rv2252/BmrU family lipid kinase